MPRPGPSVTSGADLQPGSDSLFPSGFGGGAAIGAGRVGTSEIADGSIAAADLNLSSVATSLAARSEFTGAYASLVQALTGWALSTSFAISGTPTTNTAGVITSAAITWPDGGTGAYTATSTDSNGAVTAFTATTTGGPLGSKTVTVTIPRDSSSVVSGAMTVAVA